jgi:predicted Zn finger-like uncharacterized protein
MDMILACPACQTRYQVDAAKFPLQGRSVRCARCGEVWHAMPSAPEPAPAPEPEPASAAPEPPREAFYAQPAVRDPEPQDYAAVEDQAPASPSPGFWRRRWVLAVGWLALIGVVLVVGLIAGVYRREVVEAWPKSASLYSKLGMKVASNGLKIDNTKLSKEMQGNHFVLTIRGAVTNVIDRELPVPQIRIGLVDSAKRELYHWTVTSDAITLKPGQTAHFVAQLSNPPDEAANYRIGFAKAGE